MKNAIRNASLSEIRFSTEPRNDDAYRNGSNKQVSAKRLPSFEAAFDLVTELDGLIASQPGKSVDAHFALDRDRVRALLS